MPVVASTAALAALVLPFAILGARPGLELLHPMALVLLGGLVTSTLVTLFVVPSLHLHLVPDAEPGTPTGLAEDDEEFDLEQSTPQPSAWPQQRRPRTACRTRNRSSDSSPRSPTWPSGPRRRSEHGRAELRVRGRQPWPRSSPAARRPRTASASSGYQPSVVEEVADSDVQRVTFTKIGAERVGPRDVAAAQPGGDHTVVPYAALIYDGQGDSWVYTAPSELTFLRAEVVVDRIEGDTVLLSDGLSRRTNGSSPSARPRCTAPNWGLTAGTEVRGGG